MEQTPPPNNIRRTLLFAAGLLPLIPLAKLFNLKSKPTALSCAPPPTTVKLLTQDGRLVEVDASKIGHERKKITNKELKEWVKG